MFKDFLGVEYRVGDYVAAGGAGNGPAEYGMILYRVTEVDPKLKLVRLSVSYPTHSANHVVVTAAKITAKNTNKYVVVQPPAHIVDLFERAVAGTISQDEANLIGRWLHGADHQVNLF